MEGDFANDESPGQVHRSIEPYGASVGAGFPAHKMIVFAKTFEPMGVRDAGLMAAKDTISSLSFEPMVELALTIILIDVLTYFMHVLFHRFPILWRFHRMHHSDTGMDVTTGARFHIGEHAISIIVRCGCYALFAMKLEHILLYEIVFLANVFFHHANISIGEPLDRLYRIFLTSPNMHKVHHSDTRIETDSNYTSLFSIWDRVFGTYRIVNNPKDIAYGIKGLEEDQTVIKMLLTPFKTIETR